MLSFAVTYSNQLSTIWRTRLSDDSDGQTSDGARKHAFPYSNKVVSTIHHPLRRMVPLSLQKGMTRNLLTKIKCFLSSGEIIVHPNLGALNKPSLTMVKKNYSSSTFAFIGILPLPGRSRFVKIYLTLQSLTAFCFSLRPPSSGYSCIRHYLLVPYGF